MSEAGCIHCDGFQDQTAKLSCSCGHTVVLTLPQHTPDDIVMKRADLETLKDLADLSLEYLQDDARKSAQEALSILSAALKEKA